MVTGLLLAAAAAAQPPGRCLLQGRSNDRDAVGLRVREKPALASREVGRLPPAIDTDNARYAPNFDIVDVRDGWVRIANADDLDNPGKPRPVFRGTGWIHGSRVAFTVQSDTGRARPDRRSPAIVRASDWLGDAGGQDQPIVGCSGGWARLRYRFAPGFKVTGPRSGEAWFGGICGNQQTTCDGLDEAKSAPGR